MTPREYAARLRRYAALIPEELARAEADTLEAAYREALALSAGAFSSRELRRLGHPYAKRANRRRRAPLPQDPAIINEQSGRFAASWQKIGPVISQNAIVTRLTNTSEYARFLHTGTGRMIARPIIARIRERVAQMRRDNIAAAYRRAWERSR